MRTNAICATIVAVAVIAAGPVANRAVEAAEIVKKETGWNPSIYNIRYIKPIDETLLKEISKKYRTIITVEDGCTIGGLHGAVAEYMSDLESPLKIKAIGIPDRYLSQGTQEELKEECGLTTPELVASFKKEIEKNCKKD